MKRILKIALAAFLACLCALSLMACNASDEVTGGENALERNARLRKT